VNAKLRSEGGGKLRLKNQRIVISGSTTGIGFAMAHRFVMEGARVVCNSHLAEPVNIGELRQLGDVHYVQADQSTDDGPAALIDRAYDLLGGLDHFVSNVGIFVEGGDSISHAEAFDLTYRINVRSGFLGSHHFRRRIGKRDWDASILFIGSVNSLLASPGHTAYDGSKGAVLMHARSFAVDFAKYGIRVNAIGPGQTRTPLTESDWVNNPRFEEEWSRHIPMERSGIPSDCAGPAVFFLSSDACYVTGQILYVDGGNTAAQIARF
jgi:NAD(P)-dependent dehydrogenase (short-subunit alcohol dehydrogenase family)